MNKNNKAINLTHAYKVLEKFQADKISGLTYQDKLSLLFMGFDKSQMPIREFNKLQIPNIKNQDPHIHENTVAEMISALEKAIIIYSHANVNAILEAIISGSTKPIIELAKKSHEINESSEVKSREKQSGMDLDDELSKQINDLNTCLYNLKTAMGISDMQETNFVITKKSHASQTGVSIKDLVSKDISKDPEKLKRIIDVNEFNQRQINPDNIPFGTKVFVDERTWEVEWTPEYKRVEDELRLLRASNGRYIAVGGAKFSEETIRRWNEEVEMGMYSKLEQIDPFAEKSKDSSKNQVEDNKINNINKNYFKDDKLEPTNKIGLKDRTPIGKFILWTIVIVVVIILLLFLMDGFYYI